MKMDEKTKSFFDEVLDNSEKAEKLVKGKKAIVLNGQTLIGQSIHAKATERG